MKIDIEHITKIRTAFQEMQNKEDLLQLMNEVKPLVYGDKSVPFELKQLTWFANPKLGTKRYTNFKIRKKTGAERNIHAPVKGLKAIQKVIGFILQCMYEPHKAANGFVRERSIVDNARTHEGNKYVYNIDLKDFFPSIDQARVWKCFQLNPFSLTSDNTEATEFVRWEDFKKEAFNVDEEIVFQQGIGRMFTQTPQGTLFVAKNFDQEKEKFVIFGKGSTKTKEGNSLKGTLWLVNSVPTGNKLEIANILASICCTELEVERMNEAGEWQRVKRNVLPQGAPTSPVITNIVCQRLDYLLTGLSKRFGLKYSRYADDITFSSMHNVYQVGSDFLKELHRIIDNQGFHIKESKTRLQKEGYRKEVTGLIVNEKVNVSKRYIKQLRMWIYFWERYGSERAYGFFLHQYLADKAHISKGKPDMSNVIGGKLNYLRMVKGSDNQLYLKLKARYDALNSSVPKEIKIETVAQNTKENSEERILSNLDTGFYSIQTKNYRYIIQIITDNVIVHEDSGSGFEILSTVFNDLWKKNTPLPDDWEIEKMNNLIDKNQDVKIVGSSNSKSTEELKVIKENTKLLPHNPLYTVAFLKKFKIGDGSGFKELVHDVELTEEVVNEILLKVKSHPNFTKHFNDEWVKGLSYLNPSIQQEVIKLIELFENEGVPYFKNSQKHPYNNDQKFSDFALKFKKKYRYGSGREYSTLSSDITNVFNQQEVLFNGLVFLPDERKFNIRSSFFTWQPSLIEGIKYIAQGIKDHTNIDGDRNNLKNKKIEIGVERKQENNNQYVELIIKDCLSVSMSNSETLLYYLKESLVFKYKLRNLCDWIVECDFEDENSKRFNLLLIPEVAKEISEIEELPSKVGGFINKLRFYDVK